jgi:hypothetical protein
MWRSVTISSLSLLSLVVGACASATLGGVAPGAPPIQMAAILSEMAGTEGPVEELFTTETPLVFVLEADFHELREDRSQESEERPARIILAGLDGDPLELPLQVRTRGNFRLREGVCPFPMLRLNFPTSQVEGTVFEGQDKVKLVTHCWSREAYEQNMLEEYLAYRIYGLLTDVSFRVQLASITYLDSSGEDRPFTRMAFLLEDEDVMAARLGGEMIEGRVTREDYDPELAGLISIFQYMIGNTDWSLPGTHNMKLVRRGDEFLPIPYDLDFSGLVEAPYALPHPTVADQIDSVKDRLYRGFCSDRIDFQGLFARFNEQREAIGAVIQAVPGLDGGNRSSALAYIEGFYDVISDPQQARERIIDACVR